MSTNRPSNAMATLERGCDDGEYHVYLNTNTSHAQPDYTFYHRLVHAPTGQAVCVTHLSNGTVTMYIPSEDLAYELGQLPWLNEPKAGNPDSAQPKPVDPPLDCGPENLWLERRIWDLSHAINDQLASPDPIDWKLLADRAEQLTRHAEWLGHWHP